MPAEEETAVSCPQCDGSGWIATADAGAGSVRRCDCLKESEVPLLLMAAGIPQRYGGCRMSSFRTSHSDGLEKEQLLKALADCRLYVENFLDPEGGFRESGLLFVGPPGVGKTHLAVAVLTELIESYRVRGRFVDFTSLIHEIQSTFDPDAPGSKRAILEPIRKAEIVVLDELGAQKPTPWVSDILYLIINTRYANRSPTIFTTNYRLEEAHGQAPPLDRGPDLERFSLLSHRVPASLVSRLYEMARPIFLDGVSDYRREIRMHQHRV